LLGDLRQELIKNKNEKEVQKARSEETKKLNNKYKEILEQVEKLRLITDRKEAKEQLEVILGKFKLCENELIDKLQKELELEKQVNDERMRNIKLAMGDYYEKIKELEKTGKENLLIATLTNTATSTINALSLPGIGNLTAGAAGMHYQRKKLVSAIEDEEESWKRLKAYFPEIVPETVSVPFVSLAATATTAAGAELVGSKVGSSCVKKLGVKEQMSAFQETPNAETTSAVIEKLVENGLFFS
jgi:hypothetical protein